MIKSFFYLLCLLVIVACKQEPNLPDYGAIYIPGQYTNQLGEVVDSTVFENKVAVIDFVFTHCQSICPRMAAQLKRVQTEYANQDDLQMVSFSIDPENDTVERLKWYTEKIGADDNHWMFVRADKETIDQTASSLKVFQEEDETAQGGFNHQSRLILVDRNGHVRGYYNGVDPEDVDKMINDMKQLF